MTGNLGEMISRCRQNRRITQEEFAARLGVTPQAVSKWERGSSMPDIGLLDGICEVLQIDPNKLLGFENNHMVENHDFVMEKDIKNHMFSEPLAVEFGLDWVPCFVEGLKTDFVNQKRKELVSETGMLMPLLRLRDNPALKPGELRITSYDNLLFETVLEEGQEKRFEDIMEQVKELCKRNYGTILNKQLVKILIDCLKEAYPGVVDGLVPEKLSYLEVQRHLQSLLQENKSIRDMIHILEEMETHMLASVSP